VTLAADASLLLLPPECQSLQLRPLQTKKTMLRDAGVRSGHPPLFASYENEMWFSSTNSKIAPNLKRFPEIRETHKCFILIYVFS
jgi:hypothetical protein